MINRWIFVTKITVSNIFQMVKKLMSYIDIMCFVNWWFRIFVQYILNIIETECIRTPS